MPEILTSAEMRALESDAIASGRVTGEALMERAGEAVLEVILATWPRLALPVTAQPDRPSVLVLCGPGNNGGDGFVVARLMRARGWNVQTYLYGSPGALPADARTMHDRWKRIGPVMDVPALPFFGSRSLIVDALFGLGLSRPLSGFESLFQAVAATRAPVVAIDLPSGLDADARPETASWPAAPCTLCVTFHAEKPVHARLRAQGIAVAVMPIGL